MPKLIDYPRTSYSGAWEVAEVVDDTGGKCALETCARKLNRKVSGSFKAIVGSAVKFGLLTSKREMLTTTTLFRRIKHAYDKQEELLFHREAFLTPPLFTQLCRKFRSRELPVAMLDVLLIREFDVEEINAQGVAKAFVDGARMVNLLDENNVVADIDQLSGQAPPRRELASPTPTNNVFRQLPMPVVPPQDTDEPDETSETPLTAPDEETAAAKAVTTVPTPPTKAATASSRATLLPPSRPAPAATSDAVANLFGFGSSPSATSGTATRQTGSVSGEIDRTAAPAISTPETPAKTPPEMQMPPGLPPQPAAGVLFRIQLSGPGMNTQLDVEEVEDLALIRALLDKIERQLRK